MSSVYLPTEVGDRWYSFADETAYTVTLVERHPIWRLATVELTPKTRAGMWFTIYETETDLKPPNYAPMGAP